MLILRHASEEDTEAMVSLLTELGYPTSPMDLSKRIERFLNTLGNGVVVCVKDNNVVGMVAWSRSDLFILDKVKFHVEALIVSKEARGQGVGKKLLSFVESLAQDNKPSLIDLITGVRRAKDGTHDFYKNLGYQNEGPMAKLYLRKEF